MILICKTAQQDWLKHVVKHVVKHGKTLKPTLVRRTNCPQDPSDPHLTSGRTYRKQRSITFPIAKSGDA